MKRIIAALLISVFVLSSCTVAFAGWKQIENGLAVFDNIIYSKEKIIEADFTDGLPSTWDEISLVTLITIDDEHGQSAYLTSNATNIICEIYEGISSSLITGDRYLFTSEFNFSNRTHERPLMVMLEYGTPNIENYLLKAGNNGYFQTKDGVNLMPYAANTWYKVEVIMDFAAQTYEIYVNGKVIMTKRAIAVPTTKINRIIPAKQFEGAKNGGASVAVDNVGLYELKKSISDADGKNFKSAKLPLENFETYVAKEPVIDTDLPSGWLGGGYIAPATVGVGHGTSVQLKVNSTKTTAELYKNITATGSKLLITGEYYFSTTNQTRPLLVCKQNASAPLENVENILISAHNNGKFRDYVKNVDIMPYEAGKWYKIDILYDIDNQFYEVYIDGKIAIKRSSFTKLFKNINRFDAAKHWGGTSVDGFTYIDNVSILSLDPKAVEGSNNQAIIDGFSKSYKLTTVKEDDFNNYQNISELTGWTFTGTNSKSLENIDAENKNSLGIAVSQTVGASEAAIDFTTPLKGKILIKASYNFSNNNIHRKLLFTALDSLDTGKKEMGVISAFNNQNFVIGTTASSILMPYSASQWYDVLAYIDTDAAKYSLYINGKKVIDTADYTLTQIKRLFLLKHWDNTNATAGLSCIDNVGVYTLTSDTTPKLNVAMYGDTVTEMQQIQGGGVVKATLDRTLAPEQDYKLVFVLYNNGSVEDVVVGEAANKMEGVITLPVDLTGRKLSAYLWSGFDTLIPIQKPVKIN